MQGLPIVSVIDLELRQTSFYDYKTVTNVSGARAIWDFFHLMKTTKQ